MGGLIRASFPIAALLALAASAVVSASVPPAARADRAGPVIRDLRVVALTAQHPDDRIPCREFVMYAAQVVRYLQLAEEIRGEAQHAYMWFPCEVRGHLDWEGKNYEFRINLGRTAELRTADGRKRFFGCTAACDGLLLGNRAWDAAGDIGD